MRFSNLSQFYEHYLAEHARPVTRLIHCVGSLLFLICVGLSGFWWPAFFLGVGVAYGLAWLSHFLIERNQPTTFKSPLLSFLSDFRMLYELVMGRISFDSHLSSR